MTDKPGGLGSTLTRPSFLVAVLILAACAFGLNPMLTGSAGPLVKESLPLRNSLKKLSKNLGPYRFRQAQILNSAMAAALGTDEYIDWHFEDTSVADKSDPLRNIHVFITYYTGGRNRVPHTPEECWLGVGYAAQEGATVDLDIPSLGRKIPARVITFEKSGLLRQEHPTVVYTFHCNGDFAPSRTAVRYRVNAVDETYAYFCKIELSFGARIEGAADATREESIRAGVKFLDYLLPELLNVHLPDWEAANHALEAAADAVP